MESERVKGQASLGEWLRGRTLARVAVTGGTLWAQRDPVTMSLELCSRAARDAGSSFRVLTGNARGADDIARRWANEHGLNLFAEALQGPASTETVHAYNRRLLDLQPELVLAFKQGFADTWHLESCAAGTEHMCRIATRAGLPVLLNAERWLTSAAAAPPRESAPDFEQVHGETTLRVVHGDITACSVDIIVNAANPTLLGGGGVDAAIQRAAGPALLEECRVLAEQRGGCPTSDAVLTGAGRLDARGVVHTVGPVWDVARAETCDAQLAACYRNSLQLALQERARSIAFPCISTGVYGFPKERAARIAVGAVRDFVAAHPGALELVQFVCFAASDAAILRAAAG